jgi:uncharacterized repeat protein (TIGR02543 family)
MKTLSTYCAGAIWLSGLFLPTCLWAALFSQTGSLNTGRSQSTTTLLQDGRVLAVGGYFTATLSSAEIYDHATGAWTATGSLSQVRYSHTATLLTNGKVLVAGGRFDNTVVATCELYDPATGTWSGTGTMNQARQLHTATLLNNGKVLVAGGNLLGSITATAELYDPTTGTWSAVMAMGTSRFAQTATTLADGKVLVAAGYTDPGGELKSCELFDPHTSTWTSTGDMNVKRYAHAAVRLPNGKVLAIGGVFGSVTASTELYDPNTGTWTSTGLLNAGRSDFSATLLPNGQVFVTGGSGATFLNSAELYDPGTGIWTGSSTMSTARSLHTAVLLTGGRVLVVGGYDGSVRLDSNEVYDYRTAAWSNVDALDTARYFAGSTLLLNGKVLAVGGVDGANNSVASAEIYDPATDAWTATDSLDNPRHLVTTTLLRNGKVLVAAGYRNSIASGVPDAELYDMGTGVFSPTGTMVTGRYAHTATLLPNGKVLAVNGHSGTATLASSELYDPDAGTWAETGLRSAGTYSHTATLLPDGQVLVAGGVIAGSSSAVAELYNPATGVWTATESLSAARHNHTATLLPNGKVLVAGGYSTLVSDKLSSAEIYDPLTGHWSSAGSMSVSLYGHTSTLLQDGRVLAAGDRGGENGCSFYDPASNSWIAAPALNLDHAYSSAMLLLNGKVLVMGGLDASTVLSTCTLFDTGLGFDNSWRPAISTAPSSSELGNALALTGTGFRGVSGASSGSTTDSSTAYPVVQLRSLDNHQVKFLPSSPSTPWSDTAFTSTGVTYMPPGHALVTVFTNGIPSTSAFTLITDPVPGPEIVVEDANSNDLTSGLASFDFGTKGVGFNSLPKTFTVKNTGDAPLEISNISFYVGDTGSFAFTQGGGGPSTVAVNGSITFSVVLNPFSVGNKGAVLKIESNDADESEFDIYVSGTGQTPVPGSLAFSEELTVVNEEVGTQNIVIHRTGGNDGPVSVTVNSTPGTATTADYTAITDLVVNFANNETSRTVPVTIINNPASEPNENFTLTLSTPTNGAALGAPNPTTIRIIDATDSVKPKVTITTPAPNANVAEGAVTLNGTATDDKGLVEVELTLNGVALNTAFTLDASGKSATFTNPLMPVPGLNTLTARSKDTRNNFSTLQTRTFYYIVERPLTVNTNGPVGSGILTAPFPATDNTRRVGFSYTLVATPTPGFVFNGWTANDFTGTGVTPAMAELPKLTFTHQENLVLTANFIANPFTTDIVGKFNGLVLSSFFDPFPNGTMPSNENNGLLTATVTVKTGGVSGKVKIDGLTLPFSGVFDNSGVARFGKSRATQVILPRKGKSGLTLSLNLDMSGSTNQITGILTKVVRGEVMAHSDIIADRAYYSAANPVPTNLAGTSKQAYTCVFLSNPLQNPIFEEADYPQGHGYATGTISTTGTVSLVGKLADNTMITLSMPLAEDDSWPLFAQLYGNKGSISGHITVNDSFPDTDMTCGGLMWFRPYLNSQWYPFGWDEGILVNLIGSKYNVPPATPPATVFPDLDPVDPINGNAALRMKDGLLTSLLDAKINIAATTNKVTLASTNTTPASMSIVKTSGLFTGSFTHTNGTKPAFQGVIYQKDGMFRGGWGYFMTAKPKVLNFLGESGSVNVDAN